MIRVRDAYIKHEFDKIKGLEYWLSLPEWTISEAFSIIKGTCPYSLSDDGEICSLTILQSELEIAELHIKSKKLRILKKFLVSVRPKKFEFVLDPAVFVSWAIENQFEVHSKISNKFRAVINFTLPKNTKSWLTDRKKESANKFAIEYLQKIWNKEKRKVLKEELTKHTLAHLSNSAEKDKYIETVRKFLKIKTLYKSVDFKE